jgi:hypothetical protein
MTKTVLGKVFSGLRIGMLRIFAIVLKSISAETDRTDLILLVFNNTKKSSVESAMDSDSSSVLKST